MVDDELTSGDEMEKHPPDAPEPQHDFGELRHYVPQDLLDVSFRASRRGYDREAVDAYIKRVNRVIAELKVRSSPPAAVRHALDRAEAKVQGLLRAAREAAEEITSSARQEAEESTAQAKAEAVNLVVNASADADRVKAEAEELITTARADADETLAAAHTGADAMLVKARADADEILARANAEADERRRQSREELAALRKEAETRLRELQADTESVWNQRRELLDDLREMASRHVNVADAAAARIQRPEPARPDEPTLEPEGSDKTEPREVAMDASAPITRASEEDREDQPQAEAEERPASTADA